jgi:hypothetical protein
MPDLTIVEKATHEIASAGGNQYGVRWCSGLELGREVRGLTDRDERRGTAARTGAAHHNEPRRYTDPHMQRWGEADRELYDRVGKR